MCNLIFIFKSKKMRQLIVIKIKLLPLRKKCFLFLASLLAQLVKNPPAMWEIWV